MNEYYENRKDKAFYQTIKTQSETKISVSPFKIGSQKTNAVIP